MAEAGRRISFRPLWKKSKRQETSQEENASPGNSNGRKSRVGGSDSSPSGTASTESPDAPSDEAMTASQKRRKQVYQAQKRHRNRQSDYVKILEAEIARLQHLDARVSSERATLDNQNQKMRALLSRPESGLSVYSPASNGHAQGSQDRPSSGTIAIRHDPQIGYQRVFVDVDEEMTDSTYASAETPGLADPLSPVKPRKAVKGDSWAALDFILALEHPCQSHIPHVGIAPDAKLPVACKVGLYHGHALTTTSAVFSSASPSSDSSGEHVSLNGSALQNGALSKAEEKWQLPHSEIDRLVQLSEQLDLDYDQITPAQAYAAVKREVPSDDQLRPLLNALRKPMADVVQCLGIGSVLPAQKFSEALDEALKGICGMTI